MNVDDIALPAGSDAEEDFVHISEKPPSLRTPLGTLKVEDDDGQVYASNVRRAIEESQPCHQLILSHCQLGDEQLEKVLKLKELPGSVEADRLDHVASEADDEEDSRADIKVDWMKVVSTLLAPPTQIKRVDFMNDLRELELNDNALTSKSLVPLSAFIKGNANLQVLNLMANRIGSDPEGLALFAQSIGCSALRRLRLTSNPLLAKSFVSFFDSLPWLGTCLETLEASVVLGDAEEGIEPTPEEALEAARAVARFLSDPRRSRGLRTILLNANSFDYKCVRAIVASLVGTAYGCYPLSYPQLRNLIEYPLDPLYESFFPTSRRLPNRSIEWLDVISNISYNSFRPVHQDNSALTRLHAANTRLADTPPVRRSSISQYLLLRSQQRNREARRLNGVAGGLDLGSADASTVRRHDSHVDGSQSGILTQSLEGEDPAEIEKTIKSVGGDLDEWSQDFEEAVEIGSGVDHVDWQKLVELRTQMNKEHGVLSRRAAVEILRVARALGCCTKRGSRSASSEKQAGRAVVGFPKFLDLPPELRLMILRHLDTEGILSDWQFNQVISFACDRTTIGYGEREYDWGQLLTTTKGGSATEAYESLPSRPWSWLECFEERAAPRNWYAQFLDTSDTLRTAGPECVPEKFRTPKLEKLRSKKSTTAGTIAFWHSTGTHRPDSNMPFLSRLPTRQELEDRLKNTVVGSRSQVTALILRSALSPT